MNEIDTLIFRYVRTIDALNAALQHERARNAELEAEAAARSKAPAKKPA